MAATTYIKDVNITSNGSTTSYLIEPALYGIASVNNDGNGYNVSMPTGFTLIPGATIQVKFTTTNVLNATLNVSNLGAKSIYYNGEQIAANTFKANHIYTLVYDNSSWHLTGDIDTNTQRPIGTGANDAAAGNHGHGNITSDGKMAGSTASGAVTTSHKFLREDGTWVIPSYTIDTWRGIQDNLTSSANTTESLSAKQGYLLANGSARDDTKLPLAGGVMTGTIRRLYSANSDNPIINLISDNKTVYLWKISSGSADSSNTQSYGYALQYYGEGAGQANYLRLKADNQNQTTKYTAIGIDQSGHVGIGNDANASYQLYVKGQTLINNVTAASHTAFSSQLIIQNGTDAASNWVALELLRGTTINTTYTSWQIIVEDSGNLHFRNNYLADGSGLTTTYAKDIAYFIRNTSELVVNGKITGSSFSGSGASLTSLNASNISSGTLNADRLATSGATAGSYGPSAAVTGSNNATMNVPYITVDNKGRVTAISNKVYTAVNTWRGISDSLEGTSSSISASSKALGDLNTKVNGLLAASDALVYKGVIAGTATDNNNAYGALTPAANCGDTYKVSAAGFINGLRVEVGDMLICTTDNTAAATTSGDAIYTTIRDNWNVIQTSEGSVSTSSTSSTDNTIARFDGTSGRIIQESKAVIDDNGNISTTQSDTTGIRYKVTNSNGSVSILTSTNRGLYDETNANWIIHRAKAGDHTYIQQWASKGSSTLPVYFNSSGEPATISSITLALTANTSSESAEGFKILSGTTKYANFYLNVKGTTSAVGIAALSLGNQIASGTSENAKGTIWLYGTGTKATQIETAFNGTSGHSIMYFPNHAGPGYLVHTEGTSKVGDTNAPVYIAANGRVTACTTYANATVAAAGKATNDSDGNAINTTYLKKSGGTMTGAINRYYSSTNSEPMITLRSTNADVYLFRIGHASGENETINNNYALLYKGSFNTPDNYLYLQSSTANSTTDAIRINENGLIYFGNTDDATATNAAAFTIAGGMGIAKKLYVGGPVMIGNTDVAANTGYATANSGSTNYIGFYGVNGDGPGTYNHSYIGESIYGAKTSANEKSELLLYHGNDPTTSSGLDRIRLFAASVDIQVYTSSMAYTAGAATWNDIRAYAGTQVANFTNGKVTITGNILPEANNTRDLGSSSVKWANVYATTFIGNLTGNVTGNCSGTAGGVAWGNVSSKPTSIALTGAVTATATTLGSGAISIETTVNHGHGYISSTGQITETHQIASGDRLIVTDSANATTADKNKLIATTITFDGSTATKALTQKGTWETFNNYSHPTSAGNKHIPSGGSNGQFLKYGGSSGTATWSALPTASTDTAGIIQIGTGASNAMAGNTNINNVTQGTTTSGNWRKVILAGGDTQAAATTAVVEKTNQVYQAVGISAQPSTGTLHATIFDGEVLSLKTAASNPSLTAGARILFGYTADTPQTVGICYTPNDSYRNPAGLKIMGGTSATPAWLEVEGQLISKDYTHFNSNGIADASLVMGTRGVKPTATTTDGNTTYSGAVTGTAILTLGNDKIAANNANGVNDNAKGYLRIYGASNGYGEFTYNDTMFNSNKSLYFSTSTNSGISNEVRGICGTNDYWRVAGGATASNAGYMEISTADDATEPIYVRQYTGVFTTLKRTLTLLDGSGNSSFPGTVTATGFSGPLTGNVTGNASTATNATNDSDGNAINTTYLKKSGGTMTGALKFSGNDSRALTWDDGTWYQRILTTDDSTANTAVFTFQQSNNSGTNWSDLFTIKDNGGIVAGGGIGVANTSSTTGIGISLYNGATTGAPAYGIMFAGTGTFGTHGAVTSDWATYFTMSDTTNRGWIFRRGSTNVASIDGTGKLYLGYAASTANPGIYWNPYVESASDGSDASAIYQIKSGAAGGTELRISQANDSTDIINIVAPYYIYLNSKRAFQINDNWLRINENSGFSSGVYFGSGTGGVVRTDNQFQVGNAGDKFYANSSGNGYFSNTLGVGGTNTNYKLYVNGTTGSTEYVVNAKVRLEWNATDLSLDFVFV